nr:unnamed protein product [Digitaria exilis]
MGKSLVIPRAVSFSTIRPEIPSFAISSPPSSSPAAPPAPGTDPSHDAGVALNPRGLGEASGARRAGPGGAGGGERSAARRGLRHLAAAEGGEEARARRSREIIVAAVEGNGRQLVAFSWRKKTTRFFFFSSLLHFLASSLVEWAEL